jgi:O-antigen/teichoic acid export membrane protein
MSQFESWKAFLAPKLHRVIEFLASLGITMAGNLFYGFLCVRLLPIPEYAKFAVVFATLGTITVLMDISFSTTLLPLIGERIDDRQLIADYVASLRQLAHWLYLLVAPVTIVVFPIFVHRQQWSWRVVTGMVVILLLASWCSRVSGAYGAVLIVRRDRKSWYRAQMISSLGTLTLLGVVHALHALNAFSAILVNVTGIIFLALTYFLHARGLLGVAGSPSAEKRKAVVHLALPSVPNVIFYALQGQISMLLITLFGHASEVASIGALGRLSQIFALFSQMSPLLIEPYFARLPRGRLQRHYLGCVAVMVLFCLFIAGLARAFPEIFLWILGSNYSSLRYEVFLIMTASSIAYLSSGLSFIHYARRFVYWWNGMAVIVLTVAVEICFICKADLSSIRSILMMNLWTIAGGLLVNVFTGIYGFVRGPREISESATVARETNYA